jgi:hypothetical protein
MPTSKQKFKVGDRVSVTGKISHRVFKDARGTVLSVDKDDEGTLEIEFNNWNEGHNGTENPYRITDRWFIYANHFKKVTVIEDREADPIIDSHVLLPTDAKERKEIPLASGLFDYFPSALIEVAKVSFKGNQQHNPGEPLHWSREKSTDHPDTMLRHFMERGTLDTDGTRHSVKLVWRALAMAQLELEADGYPKARGAR